MNEHELKAVKAVEEFCESELGDLSYFEGWKVVETESHYDDVYVDFEVRDTTLSFMVNNHTGKLSIDTTGEGSWCEIATYDWTVKYFWWALLSWD